MAEKWQDEKWAEDIWYRGKVTRRTLVGWGGGAIGAMMLVPAPWRAAFGAAKPFKIGSEQPLSGAGAAGGKTAVVGLQMAADRINAVRRHQRPSDRAGHLRRRELAGRCPPEDREDGARGQYRHPCRRLLVQHLHRLHAGLGGRQDHQHDQRLPRHHADHVEVQPLQLPRPRLSRRRRPSPSGRCWPRWARSGTSPLPIIPGASRRATPTPPRSRRTAAKWSAPPASRSAPPT